MSDSCTGIIANPDLVGIGTRVNLYVTMALATLTPEIRIAIPLLDSLHRNAVFLNLALVVTAAIQTLQKQLDLYHALLVVQITMALQMVHASGFNKLIIVKNFDSKPDFRDKIMVAVQVFSILVSHIWTFYVWAKVSRFGAQPECNHLVKFVFFFVTVRATVKWLQIVFLLLNSVELIVMLSISGNMFKSGLEAYIDLTRFKFSLIHKVYHIVVIEVMIHRNKPNVQPGENAWGFGQIVNVVMISSCILGALTGKAPRW